MSNYDVIILGAGPAGYTAGIYLARFLFKTLLIDLLVVDPKHYEKGASRSITPGAYHNVPGFPGGITRHELKWKGIQQAQEEGCDYQMDSAVAVTQDPETGYFLVHGQERTYHGKNLIFATGIEDDWADLPGLEKLVGHSLFWSVELNGKDAQGKSAVVIGHDDIVVQEALHLQMFTNQIYVLTHGKPLQCSEKSKMCEMLSHFQIQVYEQRIKTILCKGETLEKLVLEDGQEIKANILFSPSQFQRPRNALAVNLGVNVDSRGYLIINQQFETNIPSTYAVGDIATKHLHKSVLCAYYQGMEVAWVLHDKQFRTLLRNTMSMIRQ